MNKELTTVGFVYSSLILAIWLAFMTSQNNKQLEKLSNDILEVKRIAIDINEDRANYIAMLQSMNEYADQLEKELEEFKELERLKKDLR